MSSPARSITAINLSTQVYPLSFTALCVVNLDGRYEVGDKRDVLLASIPGSNTHNVISGGLHQVCAESLSFSCARSITAIPTSTQAYLLAFIALYVIILCSGCEAAVLSDVVIVCHTHLQHPTMQHRVSGLPQVCCSKPLWCLMSVWGLAIY